VAPHLSPPPQVIVLGPPGAGKGTQAARLAKRLGLVHISPGDILREEHKDDSPTDRRIRAIMRSGGLVPDELIDRVVCERLAALPPHQGFVLDGYPRTAVEASSLRESLARLGRLEPRPLVIYLEVPRDELLRRLRRRQTLEGRADDSEAAIARRLATHDAQAPVVREALGRWAEVVMVPADGPADTVTEDILAYVRRHGLSLASRERGLTAHP
jgi:adenylate kinase